MRLYVDVWFVVGVVAEIMAPVRGVGGSVAETTDQTRKLEF